MASGDTLLTKFPKEHQLGAGTAATPDERNNQPVLDFADNATEEALFPILLPRNYAGGGTTVTIVFSMSTATTGNVVIGLSWERQDTGTDLDTDSFAAENTATVAVPAASGQPAYATITFTDGAQMDNIAVGESGRLRFRRLGGDAGDTAAGDLELRRIEVRET